MRLILALALVSTTAATAREPARPIAQPDCRAPSATLARNDRPLVHPLNREPEAKLYRAVDYREDGCHKPVIVSRSAPR